MRTIFLGYIKKLQETVFDHPSDIHFVLFLSFQRTVQFVQKPKPQCLKLICLKVKVLRPTQGSDSLKRY